MGAIREHLIAVPPIEKKFGWTLKTERTLEGYNGLVIGLHRSWNISIGFFDARSQMQDIEHIRIRPTLICLLDRLRGHGNLRYIVGSVLQFAQRQADPSQRC